MKTILSQNLVKAWGSRTTPIEPTAQAQQAVATSHSQLLVQSQKQQVYGLHTHYGANVTQSEQAADFKKHQMLLLDYLCVGVGPHFSENIVRRALKLQVHKLSQGASGIHPDTFRRLVELSNASTLPQVPQYGSLGASGDLIPMAHAVRPIFEAHGVQGPRDVISCVNTNSMMSSLAVELLPEIQKILHDAHQITGLVAAAVEAPLDAYDSRLLALGANSEWTILSGHKIANVASTAIAAARSSTTSSLAPDMDGKARPILQQRYSLRCSPQIFGALARQLEQAIATLMEEASAVADNPILIADSVNSAADGSATEILHGGLFYAIGLAQVADVYNEICNRVVETIDRQILLLMDPQFNGGLPANLFDGVSHCKGLHQLISSLAQKARSLTTPSRALSFSCEGNNQDVVPCAMNALIQASELLSLSKEVLRAAYFTAYRGVHLRTGSLSKRLTIAHWPTATLQSLRDFDFDFEECVPSTLSQGESNEFRRQQHAR
jgi:histidine ammonia-lyase